MKAFVSWSGGKDCMYALHKFLSEKENQVVCLLNFCEADSMKSRSHGLDTELIEAQAEALDIPLVQEPLTNGSYEFHFKQVVARLKLRGVTAGVFGDIYLREHRDWLERVCRESGIVAVFPLWGQPTHTLLQDFIADGYKTLIISVKDDEQFRPLLGQIFSQELFSDLAKMEGVDPCGENGEYHSFVTDGPLFRHPVSYESGEIYHSGNHFFLPLNNIEK
ncbi:MAG: diphthine--ammonia ligase [Bacteroidales bacterium]